MIVLVIFIDRRHDKTTVLEGESNMHGAAEILVPKTTYCNTGAVNRIHGTADILVPKTTYGNTGATSCM